MSKPPVRVWTANPTQRPEERDWLSEIEGRLTTNYDLGSNDTAEDWNVAFDDIETLINEVERLTPTEATTATVRRSLELGGDTPPGTHLVYFEKLVLRITELEADVKELRERAERAERELYEKGRLGPVLFYKDRAEQVSEERDRAQHEAGRLHECRDQWKEQAESLSVREERVRKVLREWIIAHGQAVGREHLLKEALERVKKAEHDEETV